MKNNFYIFALMLLSALAFSCRTVPRTTGPYKEAAAKNSTVTVPSTQQQQQPQVQQPQPQQSEPQAQQPAQNQPNYDAKEEVFSMISITDAPRLKTYSVVIGSFMVEENAKRLKTSLQPDYDPIIVINEKGMFRVILNSFDNYNAAKDELIHSIRNRFPDAWILTQKR